MYPVSSESTEYKSTSNKQKTVNGVIKCMYITCFDPNIGLQSYHYFTYSI